MISQIKQVSLELLKIIDELAQEEIKYNFIKRFWLSFVKRGENIIMRKPDAELKLKLDKAYSKMLPIYQMKEMSKGLTEGIKLNSPIPALTPEIKKLLELEVEEIL